jgi:hypothetical protein
MTSKWLDYPMCGDTRPSVLWDNLTALQPATVKEAQTVLFIRKLPRHIRNLINPQAFKEPDELIQRCNELWADQTPEEAAAAAAAAATRSQSPFRSARRSLSPFRRKAPGGDRSGRRRSPTPGRPEAAATIACVSTTPASATRPTSARRTAPTRKSNRPTAGPYFAAAAGPIPACCPPLLFSTGISHSYVHFPYKKPNIPS